MVALNVLRGVASLVPALGGATYMGSEKPEGIEDVFKAVTGTSGISRGLEGIMSLKDKKSGKIIPFQKQEKDEEEDPNRAPDPDSLPDMVNLDEEREKEKNKISIFADSYDGKLMESVFRYVVKAGIYDTRDAMLGVMNTPMEQLEDVLKKADPYYLKPDNIMTLDELQKIYDRDTNEKIIKD
jgi:hypothetical protein